MKKRISARPICLAILLILVALLSAGPALANGSEDVTAPGRNVPAARQQQVPTDPAELEAFLDELAASQMQEHHIAGMAISVVKDGEPFFAKGYGYADLEQGIPVHPEQTIFRIGSISKLFTWTAVMQLVEQGVLDLDTDVNTYLDFRIPDTYSERRHSAVGQSGACVWRLAALSPRTGAAGIVLCVDGRRDGARCAGVDGSRRPAETPLLGHRRAGALHAGDGRSSGFFLVPGLLEPAGLAILAGRRHRG